MQINLFSECIFFLLGSGIIKLTLLSCFLNTFKVLTVVIKNTVIFYIPPCTSVQFSSVAQSCLTLCDPMNHSTPGLPVHRQLLEFTQTHVHRVGGCHPAISSSVVPFSSPIPPSIRVFSNESTLRMRWPKYWSFSFSIIPSKEHPGLISFRINWLDLLAVQGTLKSLLQHHSSKASILRCSAFLHSPTFTSIHDHRKNHSLD